MSPSRSPTPCTRGRARYAAAPRSPCAGLTWPVVRVTASMQGLRELRVGATGDGFTWGLAPAPEAYREYLEGFGVALVNAQVAEICFARQECLVSSAHGQADRIQQAVRHEQIGE